MSTIVRYSNGNTYTIVPNKVEVEKVQDLDGQYHVPYTSIVGMLRLGLGVQRITVSGDALDMSACLWHDVVAISFDSGISYQTVYFAGVPYTSDCWSGIYPYALSLLASPLKEQTAVRYPTTGYKWGNQSITGISQAGNVNAYPIIHYLAPLFYAPLSNTLIDFAGQSVTFTRTAPKTHNGVVYPINTPIFDSGLYLASDTAQDVATWTPPASTLKTIAMQIQNKKPLTGANLITNGEFETNVTGWTASDSATISRTTVSPIVGAGSLKILATTSGDIYSLSNSMAFTVGHVYIVSLLAKSTAAAGKLCHLQTTGGQGFVGPNVDCSAGPTRLSIIFTATGTGVYALPALNTAIAGEYLLVDSVICYDITAFFGGNYLTVWSSLNNFLYIDFADNRLKWTDNVTSSIETAFPLVAYLYGEVIDIVVLDDASHAVTVAAYTAWYGGLWTSTSGSLSAITWSQLTLGNLEGSIANLIQYGYVLTSAEYRALAYSSLSLLFNTLYIGNRYAGEVVKGSDKRLLNVNGSDISALLGGTDVPIGASAVTIAQSQGLSARWYVEVKRTDV